jgi:hypothetical protein
LEEVLFAIDAEDHADVPSEPDLCPAVGTRNAGSPPVEPAPRPPGLGSSCLWTLDPKLDAGTGI